MNGHVFVKEEICHSAEDLQDAIDCMLGDNDKLISVASTGREMTFMIIICKNVSKITITEIPPPTPEPSDEVELLRKK